MTNGDHKKRGFEPLHDAHAIEQVVFAVQFLGPLDESTFKEASDILDPITGDLPKKSVAGIPNLVAFTIGDQAAPLSMLPPAALGRVYQSFQPDGTIGTEVRLDRGSMVFRTTLYTRWAATWSRAQKYFGAVIPKCVPKTRIAGVSLNYVDKFIWTGDPAECRPANLLEPKSKYLCPHVYDSEDLWHSHTGAFSRVDNQTKRLLNVNVDYIDERKGDVQRRMISIGTALSDLTNQPDYAPLDIAEKDAISFIDSKMQHLHDFGKIIFANIVNDEMSKRIALKA